MQPSAEGAFRDELFEAGYLIATGHDGLYLRSAAFEHVVNGIDALVTEAGADHDAPAVHIPLVVPRALLERTDYVRSFPDLVGVISTFNGEDAAHLALIEEMETDKEWANGFELSDLALCSAACHPLYPVLVSPIVQSRSRYEVFGNCFRHEPSIDPARMQVFRQHEFVYVGDASGARKHRDIWIDRGLEIHRSLGLAVNAVVANDPFFGRSGSLLAQSQRAEALKIELVAPTNASGTPTAITSANCHLDHFGAAFSLRLEDGSVAYSACVGFGVERITLALLWRHGLDLGRWPREVKARLGL